MPHQKTELDAVQLELLELTVLEMEQELTEVQAARLKDLVCSNPDACKYYVSLQHDKIFLNEIAASADAVLNPSDIANAEAKLPPSTDQTLFPAIIFNNISNPVAISLAGGILFALILAGILQYVSIQTHFALPPQASSSRVTGQTTIGDSAGEALQRNYIAKLTGIKDAVWTNSNHQRAISSRLFSGEHLSLDSGLIELRFKTGARVVVAGPAELVLGGEDRDLDQPNTSGYLNKTRAARCKRSRIGCWVHNPNSDCCRD